MYTCIYFENNYFIKCFRDLKLRRKVFHRPWVVFHVFMFFIPFHFKAQFFFGNMSIMSRNQRLLIKIFGQWPSSQMDRSTNPLTFFGWVILTLFYACNDLPNIEREVLMQRNLTFGNISRTSACSGRVLLYVDGWHYNRLPGFLFLLSVEIIGPLLT